MDKDLSRADSKTLDPSVNVVENQRDVAVEEDIDESYLAASKFTKLYRSVLLQMILFGALSFVGPAMSDAISNLGGGGLATPFLANLARSLQYAGSCIMTLVGGPVINRVGIKWSCIIAAVTFSLSGSSYYCTSRYGQDGWAGRYLLAMQTIGGVTGGFLYVAETAAMFSYPRQGDRGMYLGIWSAMRSSGSVLGGAINYAVNYSDKSGGGIAQSTYLIFIAFEATGLIWALLLSPTSKVRRKDGSRVPNSGMLSWKREFYALFKHILNIRTWFMFIPSMYSFFYGGTYGTYLAEHFSVRSRALSTLVMPCATILMVLVYGKFVLDNRRFSQRTTATVAVLLWIVPQVAAFIWTGVNYGHYGKGTLTLDYLTDRNGWAKGYVPYLIIFTTGYWTQLSLYWILSAYSTDVNSASRTGGLFRCFETLGQAISYGINSSSKDIRVPFYVNVALFVLTWPCMWGLIRLIPEKPADHDDVVEVAAEKAAVDN